jgi:hypothetical protein
MLTRRHEHELAQIHSLALELDQSVKKTLEQFQHIRDTGARDTAPRGVGGNDSAPLLAFVHIPKTAGGTVTSMLTAAYSKQGIKKTGNYVRNPDKSERKIASSVRREGQVSAGHTPYGALRVHLPPDARYMTFLREPVDRVLSHYYRHVHRKHEMSPARREQRVATGKIRRDKADSIEEALVELRLPQLRNLATRFLSGHPSPPMTGDLPASALDDAKANLREFAFVGIQERFEESLVLLQRMLGLGSIPYRDRHVSSDRPAVDEIPDAERALIEEHNQLDAELYRFGLGLFEDAVAAADDGFVAAVEALRARSATAREEEWRARRADVESSALDVGES